MVVESHDLLADVRLEGIVRVRKWWESGLLALFSKNTNIECAFNVPA